MAPDSGVASKEGGDAGVRGRLLGEEVKEVSGVLDTESHSRERSVIRAGRVFLYERNHALINNKHARK